MERACVRACVCVLNLCMSSVCALSQRLQRAQVYSSSVVVGGTRDSGSETWMKLDKEGESMHRIKSVWSARQKPKQMRMGQLSLFTRLPEK